MAKETKFLTKEERCLFDELVRVCSTLRVDTISLTGKQMKILSRMQMKTEYMDLEKRLPSNISFVSTETRKRYKKRDMIDMFPSENR